MSQLPNTVFAFYWHFLRPYRWRIILLLAAPTALVLESTLIPYIMRMVVDTVMAPGASKEHIWSHVRSPMLLALFGYGFMMALFRLQELVGSRTIPVIMANIRLACFDRLQHQSHRFFSDQFAGSLANKIGDLSRSFQSMFFFMAWQVFGTLAVLLVTLGVEATIDWRSTLALAVWVVFHISIACITAKSLSKLSAAHAERRSELNGTMVDALSNISSVRLFAASRRELNYIGEYQIRERLANQKVLRRIAYIRAVQDIAVFIMLGVVGYLLILGWQIGYISAGGFIYIFYATLNVLFFVWHNSSMIPTFVSDYGTARQALQIINASIELTDTKEATQLEATHGEITFDHVDFTYKSGKQLFDRELLTIPGGQKVGLVGFSGAGKSTFVHLIMRLFDVTGGRILIDGQDIRTVTQDSLHESIAFIPQDPSLFHRSLMENIRYARPDASDAEVVKAAKRAQAHEFIEGLAQGYETKVGERGVKLSGGQRQRVAIARAILKNAPILIFDEATSSLDSITEHAIQQALVELMRDRTAIIIAHRLSTLSQVDRILVFHEGAIVEDGTHEELMEAGGHYAELWQMQADGFLNEL